MNPNNTNFAPINDDTMANNTATLTGNNALWMTLTDMLLGPMTSNKYDNISYKTLVTAGVTDQYIKIDLAKNLPNTVTNDDLIDMHLPMSVVTYVINKAVNNSAVNIYSIVKDTRYSRFQRRGVFTGGVMQAARQLDKDTFLSLVWRPEDLQSVVDSGELNIQYSDLATLLVDSTEVTNNYYEVSGPQKRFAYHSDGSREAIVRLFFKTLKDTDVVALAALTERDDILDYLTDLAYSKTYGVKKDEYYTDLSGNRFIFNL